MNNKVFEKAMGIKRAHYSVGRNDYPDSDPISRMWLAWQASRKTALEEAAHELLKAQARIAELEASALKPYKTIDCGAAKG